MRIGIDARELAGKPTGVGRYLAGLIHRWAVDPSALTHEFVLYAPAEISTGVTLDSRRFPTRIVPGRPGTLWEQVRLPKIAAADHLDVFFSPAYSAPLRLTVPFVVVLHDVSFFAHPEWFRTREGLRRRTMARHAAQRAAAIVTVSEFSRREIVERLGTARDKVRVIYHGLTRPPVSREPAPDAQPRVLYVGSIFNRRHVPDLIRGVAALARRRPGVSLDIVGDDRTFPPEDLATTIAHQSAGGYVRWHAYASDDELMGLYARARAFCFLSEYEGFGLTPIEALGAGVPPMLLDTPVARETCGAAAIYVKDTQWRTVANGLETLLFEDDVRGRILEASDSVLSRYDWGRAARETLEVLERACR